MQFELSFYLFFKDTTFYIHQVNCYFKYLDYILIIYKIYEKMPMSYKYDKLINYIIKTKYIKQMV